MGGELDVVEMRRGGQGLSLRLEQGLALPRKRAVTPTPQAARGR